MSVVWATAADGTRISYDTFGDPRGEPVLLIQGLGADSRAWVLQRAALARRHWCIAFDNRGVGRSDKPPAPYDLLDMAEDAVAVLDAAGVDSAHVMGASMGGVIAQLLALTHPHRVRSLVLACTACRHHEWRRELLAEWAVTADQEGMKALSGRSLRWLLARRWWSRLYLPAQLLASLLVSSPSHGFCAQVDAILAMEDDHRDFLGAIDVPTLVMVGSQDILTPVGDSEELAEMIPGAELVVLRGAGHALMIEQAGTFNRLVIDFFARSAGHARRLPAKPDEAATA